MSIQEQVRKVPGLYLWYGGYSIRAVSEMIFARWQLAREQHPDQWQSCNTGDSNPNNRNYEHLFPTWQEAAIESIDRIAASPSQSVLADCRKISKEHIISKH